MLRNSNSGSQVVVLYSESWTGTSCQDTSPWHEPAGCWMPSFIKRKKAPGWRGAHLMQICNLRRMSVKQYRGWGASRGLARCAATKTYSKRQVAPLTSAQKEAKAIVSIVSIGMREWPSQLWGHIGENIVGAVRNLNRPPCLSKRHFNVPTPSWSTFGKGVNGR